jgi:hypothetical protein
MSLTSNFIAIYGRFYGIHGKLHLCSSANWVLFWVSVVENLNCPINVVYFISNFNKIYETVMGYIEMSMYPFRKLGFLTDQHD